MNGLLLFLPTNQTFSLAESSLNLYGMIPKKPSISASPRANSAFVSVLHARGMAALLPAITFLPKREHESTPSLTIHHYNLSSSN